MNLDGVNAQMTLLAWGTGAPDWVKALADECDRTSQIRTAERLGCSSAMVNQVLKRTYKGRYEGIETRVKGEFLKATVVCPVLGEISTRRCLDEQVRPYANTNRQRVALFRACRGGCPNYRKE